MSRVMSEESRTDRLERLLGSGGVEKLAQSRVMVIGIGGVGSNCVEALARGGIGSFVIVDADCVQESNINRQAIAFEDTIGRPKVEVMGDMIAGINPEADVTELCERILPDDVEALFGEHPVDYCIDAQDTVATKLAIAAYCDAHELPLLSSMGAANTFDPTKLAFADIYETSNCPLSRIVRKEARKHGITSLQVLYSTEQPAQTQVREGADRSERSDLGTMSYLPAIMGQMLAARAICDILGIEWA